MKKLFIIFLFSISLFAEKSCSLDYSIMYSIQKVERHMKLDIGYPYIISFNSKRDIKKAKKKFDLNWIDSRSINCEELVKCEDVLKKLIKVKISNLDLGAFQINYKYHSMKLDEYFNYKKSYLRACRIIEGLINKYGMSADTIARYHSSTKKHRKRYARKLFKSFIDERQIVGADMFYYYY